MKKERLKNVDPEIFGAIQKELKRQQTHLELIASENFTSSAVMEATGSVLTNKYAEGYPAKRWYGGCEFVDEAENLAIERAQQLFGADYVNVQPHSGTQANMAVFMAVLQPKDTVLAMDLACGGHLSHGHPLNFSGRYFTIVPYGVDRQTEQIDYQQVESLAAQHKPKLILAGASAYPRVIDFKKFREIADMVGALLLVDMAHFAGLVAAGIYPNPVPYSDFVTSTTHKTLRGPRGGFILAKSAFAKNLNTVVFPGIQGGPLMHVIAAKAVCFREALAPSFRKYQQEVVTNAQEIAACLIARGYRIVSGGTDSHLLLVDLRSKKLTGKEATEVLGKVNITVNKNLIPYDPESAFVTSGIRIGTPAVTTRKMKKKQMQLMCRYIDEAFMHKDNPGALERIQKNVLKLAAQFPLYEKKTA